jgi:hypothetical protein
MPYSADRLSPITKIVLFVWACMPKEINRQNRADAIDMAVCFLIKKLDQII